MFVEASLYWKLNLFSLGSYPDEFESTRIIGERQFNKAVELFNKASENLRGKVGYRHTFVDFSSLEVSVPVAGGGSKTVKTCPAAMGFAFAAGTTDGPGAFDFKQGDNQVSACPVHLIHFKWQNTWIWAYNILQCTFREMHFGSW